MVLRSVVESMMVFGVGALDTFSLVLDNDWSYLDQQRGGKDYPFLLRFQKLRYSDKQASVVGRIYDWNTTGTEGVCRIVDVDIIWCAGFYPGVDRGKEVLRSDLGPEDQPTDRYFFGLAFKFGCSCSHRYHLNFFLWNFSNRVRISLYRSFPAVVSA